MTELGNVFDAVSPDGSTGPDLRIEIDVPRASLGDSRSFTASIPLTIDGMHRADPHGDGEQVQLNLPKSLPEGAVLRLRGLGGVPQGAEATAPGDLYVALRIVDLPLPNGARQPFFLWLLVGTAIVLVVLAWAL